MKELRENFNLSINTNVSLEKIAYMQTWAKTVSFGEKKHI
jgi:hypothetical protein